MEAHSSAKSWKKIPVSDCVKRTKNPIRNWIESFISKVTPNPKKSPLVFTVGDPVVYPGFEPSNRCLEIFSGSITDIKEESRFEDELEARKYLAQLYSTRGSRLTEDDIFLESGCSGALLAANLALADPGDTVLLPNPGFPLMQAICEERGVNVVTYNLNPDTDWEIEMSDLESKLRLKPKFLSVNNPSNPLGAVWSTKHIKEVLALADRYKVPILADEVYERMVLPGEDINSFGKLGNGQPVIVASGYAKMGLAPGWRLGWIVCYGKSELLAPFKKALANVSKYTARPTSLIQAKLPELFDEAIEGLVPKMIDVQVRINLITDELRDCPGISVKAAKGAMYAVLRIDFTKFKDIKSSTQFALKLFEEENVNTLPGSLFGDDSFIRIVSLADAEYYRLFGERIRSFVNRHLNSI